jgi:hypothetical protein
VEGLNVFGWQDRVNLDDGEACAMTCSISWMWGTFLWDVLWGGVVSCRVLYLFLFVSVFLWIAYGISLLFCMSHSA